MKIPMTHRFAWIARSLRLATGVSALLAGCTAPSLPPAPALPPPLPTPAPPPAKPPVPAPTAMPANVSLAKTPRDYRRDAASHVYAHNPNRIYQGKMPPQLYAIGVLQVDVDRQGRVNGLQWMRAPKHAPEVIAEIERTVRAAAPYPAPLQMGRVTWTDTWLWHKSGTFQLDTLTEGQY